MGQVFVLEGETSDEVRSDVLLGFRVVVWPFETARTPYLHAELELCVTKVGGGYFLALISLDATLF